MTKHREWLDSIEKVFQQHNGEGGFQILFPEYRPDLFTHLATALNLDFFDYRQTVMQPEGWDAGKISLDDLTSTLLEKSAEAAMVVHNVEALLAAKPEHQRKQWLAEFFSIDWPNTMIIPVTVFQADTLEGHSRICDIELIQLPKQSFLMQLSSY